MEYANWPGLERLGSGFSAGEKTTEMGVVGHGRAVASLWVPGWETGTSTSAGSPLCYCRCPAGGVGAYGFQALFTPPAHCISLPSARLISHTPSYCDESLFGSRPEGTSWEGPWMAKGDAAKLHALFWTPPATPRGSQSPRPRDTPLRAIHPAGPLKPEPKVAADTRKLSVDGLDSPRPPRRERSHSLTHLTVPGMGHPHTSASHANGPRDPRPSPSGVTFQSPLVTPRARSVRVSVPAAPQRGGATRKPKPPWK